MGTEFGHFRQAANIAKDLSRRDLDEDQQLELGILCALLALSANLAAVKTAITNQQKETHA